MITKNATDILFATAVTSRQPPVPELVLIARAKLQLVPGGGMTLLEGMPLLVQGPLSAGSYEEDDDDRKGPLLTPSDFADFKPHGEVLLTGSCHSPRGRWVNELPVKLSVGRWSKSLMVYGRRVRGSGLSLRSSSRPERFTTMPLDYRHAYGGPDYPLNPVGKGHEREELPNVVDPKDTRELPAPASFAPLSPQWPQRRARLGQRYDQDYLEKRFPYYAEDFDFRYFMAAPADQWLERYFRGDEEVTLVNLHPEHSELSTRLPGLRIRAFVNDDRAHFREVQMELDTLLIDTDACTATLTWRGLTPVRKFLATDVTTVLLVQEPLAERPRPIDVYEQQLRAFEADPLEVEARMPAGMKEMLAKLEEKAGPDDETAEGTLANVQSEEARAIGRMLRDKLGGVASEHQAKLLARLDGALLNDEQTRSRFAQLVDEMEAANDKPPPASAIPPYVPVSSDAEPRVYVRAYVELARAKLQPIREQLQRALPVASEANRPKLQAKLDQIDDAERKLTSPQVSERDPTLRPISDGTPGPGADLCGQDLSGRDLSGVDLRGAKLDGAILTDANLRGVNLEGASLRGTVLYRTEMTGCSLRGADLSQVNAAEAQLQDADLEGCELYEAYFKDASMQRCRLPKTKGQYAGFPGADLTDALLSDASFEDADFQKTCLKGADLSYCRLSRSFFQECSAQGARLQDATLDGTRFMKADLREANFTGARGERTSFMQARLDSAKLSYAVLHAVFLDDGIAPKAIFYGADLRDGRLCRAELSGARFDDANLFGADLSDAEVNGTTFRKANLYDAKLLRTAGRDCDLSGANLEMARFGGKI